MTKNILSRTYGMRFALITVFVCIALYGSLRAEVLNEWSFGFDPVGENLSQSGNTGSDKAIFGYGDDSSLITDGQDYLLCSQAAPVGGGMWTNGAVLIAELPRVVSNEVHFLRIDVKYDLNSKNRPAGSGGVVGFAVCNVSSNLISGVALTCESEGGTSAPFSVTNIASLSETGQVAIVARVDMENQNMDVWFDPLGKVDSFSRLSPHTSIAMPLSSIDALCFLATGNIRPFGSDDAALIDLVRHAESWEEALQNDAIGFQRRYLNEWTFERDVSSSELAQALNSGTANPAAQFAPLGGGAVFTGDGALYCVGEDEGQYGMWTEGAILKAALQSISTGKHYLRYDVSYDLSSDDNDSGTLLSVYFTDSAGDHAAGLVLGADNGKLGPTAPTNRSLILITNSLPRVGSLSAIAEIDLDTDTLKVWYDLAGSGVFDQNQPAASSPVSLESVGALCFHATGDFQVSNSADATRVDNIRHSTIWSEITAPVLNEDALPNLYIEMSAPKSLFVGQSNIVVVVVKNLGGVARQVSSELFHDGDPSDFELTHSILPEALGAGMSLTNTYWLTANESGEYLFSVVARSAETNSQTNPFSLLVNQLVQEMTLSMHEGRAELSWSGSTAASYGILYTFDLKDPFVPLEGTAGLTTNRFLDTVNTNVPAIFYRIIHE